MKSFPIYPRSARKPVESSDHSPLPALAIFDEGIGLRGLRNVGVNTNGAEAINPRAKCWPPLRDRYLPLCASSFRPAFVFAISTSLQIQNIQEIEMK